MQPVRVVANRFELLRVLGRGGFGEVWAARDRETGREVAVKMVQALATAETRRRLSVEARALQRLDHPNCVKIIDMGVDQDAPYLVMDLVQGHVLRSIMGAPLPISRIMYIAAQLCDALDHAHNLGITHRDLKPDNIILRPEPGGERVTILDFGLARLSGREQSDITKTGEVLGSPMYMSPEQLRGSRDVGPSCDLYALGVLLFEMLQGHPPFRGESPLEVGMQHLMQPPPSVSRPDCPANLRDAVSRLLAKEPQDRFRSARQVAASLRGHTRDPVAPSAAMEVATEVATSRSYRAIIAVLLVAVVVLFAVIIAMSHSQAPQPTSSPAPADVPRVLRVAPTAHPPEEAHVAEEAVTENEVERAPALVDGCTKTPQPGVYFWVDGTDDYEFHRASMFVPYGYEPTRPYPVVILLKGRSLGPVAAKQSSDDFGHNSKFKMAASDEQFLTISIEPLRDERSMLWLERHDAQNIAWTRRALDILSERACVDRSRVFVVGYDRGARFAQVLSCQMPVSGLALMNPAVAKPDALCKPNPIPTLHMYATKDRRVPPNGGPPLCTKFVPDANVHYPSAKDFAAPWLERNQCSPRGKRPADFEAKGGTCHEFRCKSAPFWQCAVEGGHGLVGGQKEHDMFCDGFTTNPTFPQPHAIWSFFKQHGRQLKESNPQSETGAP